MTHLLRRIYYFVLLKQLHFLFIQRLYGRPGGCSCPVTIIGGSVHSSVDVQVSRQHGVEEEEQDGGTRLQFLPHHI